ncbi:MAG: FG-GAP repeat protein, partial [Planctomycetes bacterium]|nr:FG-GAP repeat protein [Planctomycetota bacterium]
MSPRLPLSQRSVGSLWRAVFVALFACTLTGPGAAQARGQWQQTYKLTAADADAGDIFGQSVSIDGNLIVIGAQLDEDAGTQSGSAYVYRLDGSNWIEEAKLTAS